LAILTFAGLAELVLTAGVVAYFQRTNPSLLKLTAPGGELTADVTAPAAEVKPSGAQCGRCGSGWRC